MSKIIQSKITSNAATRPIKYLSAGDSVVVKPGVTDDFTGQPLGGWQGRLLEVAVIEDEELALIQWDSLTLNTMQPDFIEKCLQDELNWSEFGLPSHALVPASPRDTQLETDWAREGIGIQYVWPSLGEPGEAIIKILSLHPQAQSGEVLSVWEKHLLSNLVFPLEAQIVYPEEDGPLSAGDFVTILALDGYDEKMGIYARIVRDRSEYGLPLADLQANKPCQVLDLYRLWWENH